MTEDRHRPARVSRFSDEDHRRAREEIFEMVRGYFRQAHPERPFKPGETPVPVAGRVYGSEEMCAIVDASLDFWLTAGRFNDQFETRLAERLGLRRALTTNSGSSANLLAVSALTSPLLRERQLQVGDEVITAAAGFPTTVNPIIQNRLRPVFVDVEIPTYNPSPRQIEEAIGPRTRAIVLAHTLGNPLDLDGVVRLARKHGLWLIEDCCDALGSTYDDRPVGSFGDVGTFSFYPAHHITMGEGGATVTDSRELERAMLSLRDWGRDCWCAPGNDNTCGRRFDWQKGKLPKGYDHKYIYSHLGYNLKITDMQAAVGVAQLDRVDGFVEIRKRNFRRLTNRLDNAREFLILPQAIAHSDPAWFGFPITVRSGAPFARRDLVKHLDEHLIATRHLFAGNILRQPYLQGLDFRVVGELPNTDTVAERTFWLGVYPGISEIQVDYVADCILEFIGVSVR